MNIGSTFAKLYEHLCESPKAHDLNPNKQDVFESIYDLLSDGLENISPSKDHVYYVSRRLKFLHKIFHKKMNELNKVEIPRVVGYLISTFRQDGFIDDGEAFDSAQKITEFYGNISRLIEPVVTREYPAASLVMRHALCDECFSSIPELRRIHDIMRLENAYEIPIPFRTLIDTALGRSPDIKQLDSFIINFVAKKIDSATLHRALEAIFYYGMIYHRTYADSLDPAPISLSRFEFTLELRFDTITGRRQKEDDHLLTRKGMKHLEWRKKIKKNYKLSTAVLLNVDGVTKYVLFEVLIDAPLPTKKKKFDSNILYTITKIIVKDLPEDQITNGVLNPLYDDSQAKEIDIGLPPANELLVWISSNRSKIELRLSAASRHFGPPIVRTYIVAHDGKFALVERTKQQLGNEAWGFVMKALNYEELIIRILIWFKSQKYSPHPFKYKYYGINGNNVLCATRSNTPTTFDIQALEMFAYKTAKRDHFLFRKYSFGANLRENSSAKIIYEAALNTFSDRKYDITTQIRKMRPDDPNVEAKALAIQGKIKNRYQELKNNSNLKGIEKKELQKSILDHYQRSGGITLLLPMNALKI